SQPVESRTNSNLPQPTNTVSETARPQKKGFMQRINPVRLFSKDEKAQTETAADSKSTTPLSSTPVEPEDSPAGLQSFPRYTYHAPGAPESGNRAEAERALAQGVQAHKARHLPEAISAYRRAVQLDPAYFDAYYNLGLAANDSGSLPVALSSYETALAIRPQSPDARYSFAMALKQSGYPIDAINEFQKLLSSYPNDGRAHLALGNLYDRQLNDPVKAKIHYLKVLETDPRNPEAGTIRYWLAAHPTK